MAEEASTWLQAVFFVVLLCLVVTVVFIVKQQTFIQLDYQPVEQQVVSCQPLGDNVCQSGHCCPFIDNPNSGLCCSNECTLVSEDGTCVQ